jgi:hypothetical protein
MFFIYFTFIHFLHNYEKTNSRKKAREKVERERVENEGMAKWLIKLRKFLWIINLKEWVDFLLNEGVMEINGETQHKLWCRGNWIDIENLVPHCKRKRKKYCTAPFNFRQAFRYLLTPSSFYRHFICSPDTHKKVFHSTSHARKSHKQRREKKSFRD